MPGPRTNRRRRSRRRSFNGDSPCQTGGAKYLVPRVAGESFARGREQDAASLATQLAGAGAAPRRRRWLPAEDGPRRYRGSPA